MDRRVLLQTASALIFSGVPSLARASASPALQDLFPRARLSPVTDMYFGDRITDPYRWLEDRNDPDWLPFMQGQDRYARAILSSIPGRSQVERRLAEVAGSVDRAGLVARTGDRLIFTKAKAGEAKVSICIRDMAGGPEHKLIDAEEFGADEELAGEWSPSPDGKYLLFGVDEGGRELPDYFVAEIATGARLPDRISRAFNIDRTTMHWLPDSSGFFYTEFATGRDSGAANFFEDSLLRFHRLGTPQSSDVTVLDRSATSTVTLRSTEIALVVTAASSDLALLAIVDGTGPFVRLYAAPSAEAATGQARWSEVADYSAEVRQFAIAGDDVILLTTRGDVRGRVMRGPALPFNPDQMFALAMGDAIPERIAVARDAIYVQTMDGGYGGVKRVSEAGSTDVPLPFEGGIFDVGSSPLNDGVFILMGGWVQPTTPRRFDPVSGQTLDLGLARFPFDLSNLETVRTFATAPDGTQVPISLAMKRGLKRDGSNPVLMQAYGAYGISQTPNFYGRLLPFMEEGGIMARAHVRGGGEYGHAWHMGAFKASKPNSWRDLIACAEELIAQRYTSPRCLAIQGGSAGGITVGRAMTERPDLFTAVVTAVGINNPLRFEAAQNGSTNVQEFGSVHVAGEYPGVRAMDTYHAVRDGVEYPAVLLTTGLNDPRVPPWQVAKLAARLQAAGTSRPVLMRVEGAGGHGGSSSVAGLVSESADLYSFIFWRAGHPGFQPADD